MLNTSLSLQRYSEQVNGHSSDLDRRKSGTLLVKTVHMENGTELQSKWCWHLQKANTQSSDPWVHCLEECLRAKVVENCRYASVPMRDAIETVVRTIISVNQLSIYGAVAEVCEEYESCHDRAGRPVVKGQSSSSFVPSVIKTNIPLNDDPAQEAYLLQRYGERTEKLSQQDGITTRQIEQILYWCRIPDYSWSRTVFPDEGHWRIFTIHRFSGLSWVHFAKRRKFIWTKREGTPRLDPYGKLQPVAYKVNMEWKLELSLWTRTILTRGAEFLMAWISWSRTWTTRSTTTTSRKPQKCSSKNVLWNWMQVILKPIKGQNKAQKTRFCQLIHKNYTYWGKNLDWLNHKNIRSPITQCRRNWSIFFVMVVYLEKMMERLNSGEKKIIFRIILCFDIIGLATSGSAAWQEEEEETRKDFSIVLILQEQFCTSELSKVIEDAILLILHNRTMSWFRTVSSSTFIMLDVQSIYIPSSIEDWYREVKIWATDRQYSFCLWIVWTKNTRTWHKRLGCTASCTVHA